MGLDAALSRAQGLDSGFLDDPLELAAPLALRLSGEHCRAASVSGDTCAWYHGARLYIRALGIGQCSVPQSHSDFFARTFRELARDRRFNSVLISGSADYAMPVLILNAFRGAAKPPQLGVVDICATPLKLIDWYAKRHKVPIALHHSDVIDLSTDSNSDILCTHHLFNYFPSETRVGLVLKWHDLLRPGGKLVVVSRYRSGNASPRGQADKDRESFTESMVTAARIRASSLGLDADELVEMIRNYRAQMRAYCLDSVDELRGLLERAGFAIERYEVLSQRRDAGAGATMSRETANAIGVVARKI